MALKPTSVTGGDDLDDGLQIDDSYMVASGSGSASELDSGAEDEDLNDEAGDIADADDMEAESDIEDEVDLSRDGDTVEDDILRSQAGVKRKAAEGEEEADLKAERKKRKKQKEKERKAKRRKEQESSDIVSGKYLVEAPVATISKMLRDCLRQTFPAASPMEIEDLRIADDRLLPPLTGGIPANDDPSEPLLSRLRSLIRDKKPPVALPQVIILCISGLRCADICRIVKPCKGAGEVAKLFAKHFKMEDQIKHLAKTRVSIAVGTPGRVGKILEADGFKVTNKTVFLLDASYLDSKQRTLLTLPEARMDLWKAVFSGKARKTILEAGAQIGLC